MADAKTRHALVVDDDPLILMDASAILDDAGFSCHEAGTGAEAIAFLEVNHRAVTLLFSDVEMPGDINGFGLARHVDRHWPHIEIVIASGRIKPEAGELPDKATFIGKPFSARTVHEHLRGTMPEEKQPEPLRHAG
ncbi:response regulator [Sphingomonas sp. UYEF23]|uniref:response regulator n=1 Tax=Sphingomonas sp. UYEF23 TaxID=1756408 RepID=UPI0033988FBF